MAPRASAAPSVAVVTPEITARADAARGRVMLRTALSCLVAGLLAHAAASGLTVGYEVWTAEGARRLQAAARPLPAPAIPMAGPGVEGRTLAGLLADGRHASVVDFIYTRCTSVCSALGTAFQQMQARLLADRAQDAVEAFALAAAKLPLATSFVKRTVM